jgi:hypothetical protein
MSTGEILIRHVGQRRFISKNHYFRKFRKLEIQTFVELFDEEDSRSRMFRFRSCTVFELSSLYWVSLIYKFLVNTLNETVSGG